MNPTGLLVLIDQILTLVTQIENSDKISEEVTSSSFPCQQPYGILQRSRTAAASKVRQHPPTTQQYSTASNIRNILQRRSNSKKLWYTEMILQDRKAHTKVEEKKRLYAPNNILPLDPESGKKAIMRYPEVPSLMPTYIDGILPHLDESRDESFIVVLHYFKVTRWIG
ncbi:hypothetical protein PIB30_017606 [Stylosanthes scabra]|uniref:Uncharacterized protein n=1 Tax=Stylosanthes scabra TaxID=79078 RepID=A0ABU6VAR6_9FABA|nr:hypothetical protein [Stylosanthes scabra]